MTGKERGMKVSRQNASLGLGRKSTGSPPANSLRPTTLPQKLLPTLGVFFQSKVQRNQVRPLKRSNFNLRASHSAGKQFRVAQQKKKWAQRLTYPQKWEASWTR